MYGLDSAFPDSLQPALLGVYEWASSEWHKFLKLEDITSIDSGAMSLVQENHTADPRTQPSTTRKRRAPPSANDAPPKAERQNVAALEVQATEQVHLEDSVYENCKMANGPWANRAEIQFYRSVPKIPWLGHAPIIGCPTTFERSDMVKERKRITAYIKSVEARMNSEFESHWRLLAIDKEFTRWGNVGCQLCYASTGEPEPDHKLVIV